MTEKVDSLPLTPEEEAFTRRGFVKVAIGAAGAAYAAGILYPVFRYLNSPVETAIAEAAVKEVILPDAEKLPMKTALMFKFGAQPALLIHHEDDTWTALGAVCTHLGCTVAYQPEQNRIHCACHGGVYDPKTGANVSGPPPKPLKQYSVEFVEGKVKVSRV